MTIATAPTNAIGTGRRILSWLPLLALTLALAAVILLAAGPIGWRAGWWHFRIAFVYLMPWAAYCGLAAIALAVIAQIVARRQVAITVIAFVVGAAMAYVPWSYSQMRGTTPPIHDITTDWQNPPEFQKILPLREAEQGSNPAAYEGAKITEQQRQAYPDIAPVRLALSPPEAFARALKTAEARGWTIVAGDPAGRIEAYQRSRWFGFTDDVVVRITAADGGSRVDARSVSRWGRNDFGVNAARLRGFLTALRTP